MQSLDPTTADLLLSAVHNLKGPASRLRLLAQLLARSNAALDDDARTLVQHIEDSADAVGVMAEGLRNYAEIGSHPLQRELLDLGVLLSAAVQNMRVEIDGMGATVTQSALPVVYADRFLITWVFQELLANALRFRAERAPQVHVSAATAASENWYIAFSDNGPGIEAGLESRVFLPFKKLSAGGGAGLGLTICRKIIQLHGGEMWIEPRERGAEFRFFVNGESPCR